MRRDWVKRDFVDEDGEYVVRCICLEFGIV